MDGLTYLLTILTYGIMWMDLQTYIWNLKRKNLIGGDEDVLDSFKFVFNVFMHDTIIPSYGIYGIQDALLILWAGTKTI